MKFIIPFMLLAMLASEPYQLTGSEQTGLWYCTRSGVFVDMINDRDYVTIIFSDKAPVYFRKTEISRELFRKISEMREGEIYKVVCVQAFWRDDWQKVYDQYKEVADKLLGIE